ncbi:Beta-mannosidase precursor (Mannanase) [Scheffersomyces stipitis CBS 6054]|uniref:Beta-mannosidase B n=1 Tax=Scheffersomyces stipitis (strain ATCC 58785 / CBS 6054 / NBRC 10063 / NRRL Y-11545) TaxID=322104 RepID=A3GIC6_PICST|nr:Beta-mannosidase precursor (Mannanase) [Scheffersomyces stipitis CBS 6054]EAZ62965.2 Beta-mannosidase precursor (Mannanase) [Scheffersomyces stipitis CBS 6054]
MTFQQPSIVESTFKDWKYREYKTSEWKLSRTDAETTEIHADLLANKEIPDPFMDTNERDVQWIGEKDWEYGNEFFVSANAKPLSVHELVFEGLDTFATVYLNNEEILTTDNMFREYRVDVTKYLNFDGANNLRILFKSALHTARALERKHGKLFCFNGESSRVQVRKAQYHFGWDWGPVLITCGPYKPVKLVSYDSYIKDVYFKVDVNKELKASIDIQSDIFTGSSSSTLEIEVKSPSGSVIQTFSSKVDKSDIFSHKFAVEEPDLWYPLGHGKQSLYEFKISLENQVIVKKVGLRKVELVQESFAEQEGSSFYFKVNNIPIYCAGSNWIPAHSMQTLLVDSDYKQLLQLMIDGHQNMVRIWGGGYYEQDIFYDECDRMGILVWQDFMFACGQYPGYPEYLESVSEEAKHQLKRLRNHCSLAIYAGNNEDYQVAEQFNLEWDPTDNSGDYSKSNFPARTLYETIFPKLVSEFCPEIPYHPGSPWGGNGTADPTVGDLHQWNVWHGSQEKYQEWHKLGGRFISEFGMEALPNRKTFEACITDPDELYPQSESVDHHNKADGFERRLALYVIENIKVQGLDFDSWIYATQLMQAECLGYAYRYWRREWRGDGKRYTGGAIVWQINDCWPVTSWAIVDFYKRPKLAYYSVKRESRPIGLGMFRNEKKHTHEQAKPHSTAGPPHDYSQVDYNVDIWGVNSNTVDQPAVLKVDIYNVTSGKKLESLPDQDVVLKSNSSTEFVSAHPIANDQPIVVYSRFVSKEDGSIIASAGDWPQPLKYLKFPGREVKFEVSNGSIKLSSNKPVKGVEILVERDVFLQDNGFDLFPGDEKVVIAEDLKTTDKVTVRYYQQQ